MLQRGTAHLAGVADGHDPFLFYVNLENTVAFRKPSGLLSIDPIGNRIDPNRDHRMLCP